ncbi:MAG: 5-formyltetrahydrofolate cyclo-ligase [Alphaproteobacteria bacterium]|nr:5-formyltetrahydrofolate cyclo-ligase [Alphaproteobacteria bacterium]
MSGARWAGRDTAKDSIRAEVWDSLVAADINVGPVHSRIPNFVGADAAARNLARVQAWASAQTVKCNPDPPQIPVRLRALYDGKIVYAPIPELTKGTPFVRLDPAELAAKNVSFELAATSQGFQEYGRPVQFEEMEALDFIVVGCVAVTRAGGRTGKGGGFADLELGIFRELDKIAPGAPITTSVHSSQVVDNPRVVMDAHDSALDWIATETELIETGTAFTQPTGVAWDVVREDQYRDIPFLSELRARLSE